MKTYLISISRSAEKRKENIQAITQLFSPTVFGIDGNDIENPPSIQCKSWPRMMKIGEIGCVYSHRQVWKDMIDQQISYALVLEDDSVVKDKEKLQHIIEYFVDSSYEYVQLMVHPWQKDTISQNYSSYTPDERFGIITPEEKLPNRHIWGTNAYVIKLSFAVKMYSMTIDDPVDHMISRTLVKSKGLIYIKDEIIDLYDNHSTIQQSEVIHKSNVPVVEGSLTKKIAYCFLIKDKINQIELWENFFQGSDERCNIYIHAKYPDKVKQKWTKQYLIEDHAETGWGDIYDALCLMYKRVLKNGDYKAIFVTESHIPVKNFDHIYSYVTSHNKSHVKWLSQLGRTPGEKGTLIMQYERYINNCKRVHGFLDHIEIKHWYYNETYTILNRKHCKMFYEDNKYIHIFKGAGMWDENYPMYMFSVNNEWENLVNEQTTHVNWGELSLDKNGMRSPKYYKFISPEEVKAWLPEHMLFARKIAPECDVMKFVDLLWYGKAKRIKPIIAILANEEKAFENCICVVGDPDLDSNCKIVGKTMYVKADNTFEDQISKLTCTLHGIQTLEVDYSNVILMKEEVFDRTNVKELVRQLMFLNDDYVGSRKNVEVEPKAHFSKVSDESIWKTKLYTGRVVPYLDLQKGWVALSKQSVEHYINVYDSNKVKKLKNKELYFDLLLSRALYINDIQPTILNC